MNPIPTLHTPRLLLRPFTLADAPTVQALAGQREIAEHTANIPHPYEDGMAEAWIGAHQGAYERREAATFAITRKEDAELVGAVGLGINKSQRLAELGYWVGLPYWNQGYCTEAARQVLTFAFEELGLNRVQARHVTSNPASGRVMQKIGMQPEGTLRQSLFRWGQYHDAALYAILREDYVA